MGRQKILILGVGGLGSGILINLLRLGVGHVFLIDYDVVDTTNLNRQLLFTVKDVGRKKIQAAIQNSSFHNVNKTVIQGFHGNALINWNIIVGFAQRSDFVFNCIDWGDEFDAAVAALCLKLNKPLAMGGTFCTTMEVVFYPPKGKSCFFCDMSAPSENIKRLLASQIAQFTDLSFLARNNNPTAESNVVVCTLCVELMITHFLNFLFLAQIDCEQNQVAAYNSYRSIFYHNRFEILHFQLEKSAKCCLCAEKEINVETVNEIQSIEPKKQQQVIIEQ